MTKIYGHRGAKGKYPENTLLSFKKAIEQGVDGLELDVHLSKDGEVVVIHDETLDRTTSGTGWIKDLTLDEIKHVSAGSPFSQFPHYEEAWNTEQVPTLQEVLELLAPYPVELNIELKTYAVSYEGIEEKVHAIVEQYSKGRDVIYSSFHLPSILRMKKVNPNAKIAWLLNDEISLPEDYIKILDLEAFHLNKAIVLPNKKVFQEIYQLINDTNMDLPNEVQHYLRNKLHEEKSQYFQGLYDKIRVWTVNDPNDVVRLLDLRVNAIITDYPEEVIAIRNKFLQK